MGRLEVGSWVGGGVDCTKAPRLFSVVSHCYVGLSIYRSVSLTLGPWNAASVVLALCSCMLHTSIAVDRTWTRINHRYGCGLFCDWNITTCIDNLGRLGRGPRDVLTDGRTDRQTVETSLINFACRGYG